MSVLSKDNRRTHVDYFRVKLNPDRKKGAYIVTISDSSLLFM